MKGYLYLGLFLLVQACWADSYSRGPTVRSIFLAQDSLSVSIEDVIELKFLGYGLLIRSVDNKGEPKWIRLSEIDMKFLSDKLLEINPNLKFGLGIKHLLMDRGAKRPVSLFLEIKSIDRNQAFAIGGWSYSELSHDSLNKRYIIKFIRGDDSQWKILELLETSDDKLYSH